MNRSLVVAALAVAMAASAAQSASKRLPRHRPTAPIHLMNGLYATPDGKVTCKVLGDRMSCANRRLLVLCAEFVCTPHNYGADNLEFADPMRIRSEDETSPKRKVLASGAEIQVGEVGCSIRRTYIDCTLPDARGGFQMSDFFVRNTNIDTAPRGWPWDGRHYTSKDGFPYPL